MVTRRIVGASALSFRSFVVVGLLSLALGAQQPGTPAPSATPQPSATTPAAGSPAGPAAGAPAGQPGGGAPEAVAQEPAPVYGRVVAEEVRLRCWASAVAAPPMFEDTLQKGDVVRLGRSESGFRAVLLPLGPVGYVSKRFTAEDELGNVVTKGNKVAFRYRPRTSEAPVSQMPDATALHVIGFEDGWYRTRVGGVEAWLAAAEVEVVASDPEVVAAYEEFEKRTRAPVDGRLEQIAVAAKKRERDRIDREAVKVVEAAFGKEVAKAIPDRNLDGIEQALDKVVAEFAEDSEARVDAAMLRKRIDSQRYVDEAIKVLDSKPPAVEQPAPAPPPKDRLERFASIGWLRYSRSLGGPGVYYLEKGGRKQLELTCKTRRFDLSLFVGCEVGVIGPQRTPLSTESMTQLDVERIEVLGAGKR